MRQFTLNDKYSVVCESSDTRNGFKHTATLLTNGEIVSEWGYKQEKEFCLDYLEFITGINGVSELYEWEKDMQNV